MSTAVEVIAQILQEHECLRGMDMRTGANGPMDAEQWWMCVGCDWESERFPVRGVTASENRAVTAQHQADVVAAALTPRIDTVEQLDALPEYAVVISLDSGEINRRTTNWDGAALWWTPGSDEEIRSDRVSLPALLIYRPEES